MVFPQQRTRHASGIARQLARFAADDSAQDLIEYALLAAFIGIAGWAILQAMPNVMGATYASWIDTTNGVPGRWDPPEPASAGS